MKKTFDLISMGRSSIDLYSNDIGASFVDIQSFASYVGGCPTNIAVAANRLGLKCVLLTAVGEDPVGDFIINFLKKENVETSCIARKPGRRTSAVVLGIEPPDRFPLVYYRDNCADVQLTLDDVDKSPLRDCRSLLISGTGLCMEPSRSATLYAAEQARESGVKVFLDLDFRADQWLHSPAQDVRAYGIAVRSTLPFVDIVLGTEEELKAAIACHASQIQISHSQVSAPQVSGDIDSAIEKLLGFEVEALVVKRGAHGSSVYTRDAVVEAGAFDVEVCNVLGAGDAFAGGFIYGYLQGWNWQKSARMGNAAGALVVTRHGCANFMPYEKETLEFIESQGGFKCSQEESKCLP